ncbi:MAG: hypothetical protein OXF01_00715 [Gemmatimonadetes bacterium]|nr:hypothetical protein [Gemmatimonadota bacterium]
MPPPSPSRASSHSRYITHVPTERSGRHGSARARTSRGAGRSASPSSNRAPSRTPRSPVGITSRRPSRNIRNICAVHSPIPHTADSISTTSASLMRDTARSRTEPSVQRPARSLIARVFAAERPAPRKSSSGSCRHSCAVGKPGPGVSSHTRPYMVRAAAPASCWKVIERAIAWKCDPRASGPAGKPG